MHKVQNKTASGIEVYKPSFAEDHAFYVCEKSKCELVSHV